MKRLTTAISIRPLLLLTTAAIIIGSTWHSASNVAASPIPGMNPYPYPKATYWAWQNRPDLPGDLGEAVAWNDNALAQGWPVGPYPRKGDVAVFEPNVYGAPSNGHVAIVEQVLDDGSYITSQMDDADCRYDSSTCGKVHTRTYPIMKGMSFIHTVKDTRTTWGFASGASGWTAHDLGEGYMGGPGWYYPLTAASNDPQIVSPELDVPLAAYSGVEIEMAIGIPVTDPTIQVYFATDAQPAFSEDKSFKIKAEADGQLTTYRADFSANPAWRGNLTRLRLDPAGPGKSGGIRVDRVRLTPLPAGDDSFTAMQYRPTSRGGRPVNR
ncbi:MAG TPA: CHAP domain-containing protein [Chloroflexia bacterium]|nr:CHAP domain-containing protein [Chloroflexia bacterium]